MTPAWVFDRLARVLGAQQPLRATCDADALSFTLNWTPEAVRETAGDGQPGPGAAGAWDAEEQARWDGRGPRLSTAVIKVLESDGRGQYVATVTSRLPPDSL